MKQMWLAALLSLGVAACSSTQVRTAENDRSEYAVQAEKRLNDLDEKVNNLSPEKAAQLRAQIADTRVELNQLRTARVDDWTNHRYQVDSRLIRIQDEYQTDRNRR